MRFGRERRGATVIEYALIAGLISVMIVGGMMAIADKTNTTFTKVSGGF